MKRSICTLLIGIFSLLQACTGFHLRGQYEYVDAIQPLYIESENEEFKYELEDILDFGELAVVESPLSANAILQFTDEKYKKTPTSLDDRGLATRYNLRYTVEYVVVNRQGELLMRERKNSSSRVLEYESSQQLQAEEEERELREDIHEELANTIARNLSKITGKVITDEALKSGYDRRQ